MAKKCLVDECLDTAVGGRGYCPMHYARLRRHGDPFWMSSKPEAAGGGDSDGD